MGFTKILLLLIVSLLLLKPALPLDHPGEFSFEEGSVAEIRFNQFPCNEIEILRYENLPVETLKGLAESGEQTQTEQFESEKTESIFGFINGTQRKESTESSYKETGTSPFLNIKDDTKYFYKEVPFKVIGVTRKTCPATFPIKITAEAGYYYIPLRLYHYEKSADLDIRYVGVEIIPNFQEINTTKQTAEVQEQRDSEHKSLFHLQIATFFLVLFTTLLWTFAIFLRKLRNNGEERKPFFQNLKDKLRGNGK